MADFSALKTSIQNYIKQNGNEEITGNLLQQILLSMVTTLGDSAINDLVTALNAEIANRGNADTTLQGNINSEATARGNADTELGGRITTLQGVVNGIVANVENGYVYAGIATPSSTPTTGKVFYLALTAGTYTNFGATVVPQGINILKYNGSAWSLDSFLGLDDAPTQGSNNLVKSGGVLDSIIKDGSAFDLSAYNSGATYADLSAALTALNALPAAYKKGGMSMKFVQTSDNKYVQYMYHGTATTGTPNPFLNITNWEKINIENQLTKLLEENGISADNVSVVQPLRTLNDKYIASGGHIGGAAGYFVQKYDLRKENGILVVYAPLTNELCRICTVGWQDDSNLDSDETWLSTTEILYPITSDRHYCIVDPNDLQGRTTCNLLCVVGTNNRQPVVYRIDSLSKLSSRISAYTNFLSKQCAATKYIKEIYIENPNTECRYVINIFRVNTSDWGNIIQVIEVANNGTTVRTFIMSHITDEYFTLKRDNTIIHCLIDWNQIENESTTSIRFNELDLTKSAFDLNNSPSIALKLNKQNIISLSGTPSNKYNAPNGYPATAEGYGSDVYDISGYKHIFGGTSLTGNQYVTTYAVYVLGDGEINNTEYLFTGELTSVDNTFDIELPYNAKYIRISRTTNGTTYCKAYINEKFDNVPQISIPSKLYAFKNKQFTLYFDAIVKNPSLDYRVAAICSVGKSFDKYYQATINTTGNYSLEVVVYDHNGNIVNSKTATLIVVDGANVIAKNVLMVGDSTLANGPVVEDLYNNFNTLIGVTPNFVGTKGIAPYKHEGTPGADVWTYVSNNQYNVFYKDANEPCSITYYRSQLGMQALIDVVFYRMGINNCIVPPTKMNTLIKHVKTFVDACLADNPNCKVVIELPTISSIYAFGELYNSPLITKERYEVRMFYFSQELLKTFDNAAYNSNVVVCCTAGGVDREYGYPTITKVRGERISVNETVCADPIHPNNNGYAQIADTEFPFLSNLMV